nr:MAG TPA_asm: hypothetical protein [Caudoviricetes sp.]
MQTRFRFRLRMSLLAQMLVSIVLKMVNSLSDMTVQK